jgi:hypothetical protein
VGIVSSDRCRRRHRFPVIQLPCRFRADFSSFGSGSFPTGWTDCNFRQSQFSAPRFANPTGADRGRLFAKYILNVAAAHRNRKCLSHFRSIGEGTHHRSRASARANPRRRQLPLGKDGHTVTAELADKKWYPSLRFKCNGLLHLNRGLPGSTVYDLSTVRFARSVAQHDQSRRSSHFFPNQMPATPRNPSSPSDRILKSVSCPRP